jgi:hypothetical protein
MMQRVFGSSGKISFESAVRMGNAGDWMPNPYWQRARRSAKAAAIPRGERKTEVPATSTLAPAATDGAAESRSMPPSTSSSQVKFC